jgi:hypothetical protein
MAAALLTLVLFAALAGQASAAAPTWLQAQTIEQGQNDISGLSCPSATTCVAASSDAVVQDNGLSYERNPDPSSTFNAVSCAPGSDFCMFVDNNGGAVAFNNGTFGALADIDGDVELDSVSCPTTGFCMAIDHNNTVFMYSGGSWDGGTPLPIPSGDTVSNFVNVSCASSTFCIALVATDAGELTYKWDGSWHGPSAPFDVTTAYVVSLSCTSSSFCLETDDIGQAAVYNGTGWTTPAPVDQPMNISQPVLHSACVGMNCVAVDYYDNVYYTPDGGTTWTPGGNIHASTLISGVDSLACATATLCVAGDGVGDATTYAVPPALGKPSLSGTPMVGHALTLTHASSQTQPVFYADDWRRCANPDSSCSLSPISRSSTGYTLTTADVGKYIDVREIVGFGFDEEGPILSNIVGPIAAKPGTVKLAGSVTATRTGVVTIPLHCTGGPCKGTVKLTYKGTAIGSASYSIAAGLTAKVKITLNATGKNQFKQHGWQLPVKLIITPKTGASTTVSITLKA